MSDSLSSMPVIDVDSHWTEPPDLWTSRAPASLAGPHDARGAHARGKVERWIVEDGHGDGAGGVRLDPARRQQVEGGGCVRHLRLKCIRAPSKPRRDSPTWTSTASACRSSIRTSSASRDNLIMRIEDAAHRSFCITAYNDACQRDAGGQRRAALPAGDASLLGHRSGSRARARALSGRARAHRIRDHGLHGRLRAASRLARPQLGSALGRGPVARACPSTSTSARAVRPCASGALRIRRHACSRRSPPWRRWATWYA